MAATKSVKDRFPYEKTWMSLTGKQQKWVRRRADKARLTIPDILEIHFVDK